MRLPIILASFAILAATTSGRPTIFDRLVKQLEGDHTFIQECSPPFTGHGCDSIIDIKPEMINDARSGYAGSTQGGDSLYNQGKRASIDTEAVAGAKRDGQGQGFFDGMIVICLMFPKDPKCKSEMGASGDNKEKRDGVKITTLDSRGGFDEGAQGVVEEKREVVGSMEVGL